MRLSRWAMAILFSAALIFAGGILSGRLRAQQSAALVAPANPTPYYVINFVDIVPGNKDASLAAIKAYVDATRKESGNQRAEALSQINRTNHFVIYEVWDNQDAFTRHEASASTREFREKIGPMIGAPFDQRPHFKIE
jgi:quinol monooxygenase YgiN